MRGLTVFIFVLYTFSLFSQGINDVWTIRDIRFEFRDDKIISRKLDGHYYIHDAPLGSIGMTTLTDKNGNVVGYTNGNSLLDAEFYLTPNGSDLNSTNAIFGRPYIVAPYPADQGNRFFLFSLDCEDNLGSCDLFYSVLVIDKVTGKIDIDPNRKNVLIHQNVSNMIEILPGACNDYWVVSHSISGITFHANRIFEDKVAMNPIVSHIGNPLETEEFVQIRTKYAFAIDQLFLIDMPGNLYSYQFNRSTGQFINYKNVLEMEFDDKLIFDMEISDNGEYLYALYATSLYSGLPADDATTLHKIHLREFFENGNLSRQQISDQDACTIGKTSDGKILTGCDEEYKFQVLSDPNESNVNIETYSFDSLDAGGLNFFLVYPGFPFVVDRNNYLNNDLFPSEDTIVCGIQEVSFDIQDNFDQYLWNGETGSSNFTTTKTGWLNLEVFGQGCSGKDSIYVEFVEELEVDLGEDVNGCIGSEIEIQNNIEYTDASYQWSNGENTPSISVSDPGEYYLQVEVDGCVGVDSIVVRLEDDVRVDLGDTIFTCEGQTVVLKDIMDRRFDEYAWQDGSKNETFLATEEGTYRLSVSNSNCKGEDEVYVDFSEPIELDLGDDQWLCSGDSIWIGVDKEMYDYFRWADGLLSERKLVKDSGSYQLLVRKGGCFAEDEIVVDEVLRPEVDLGIDLYLCELEEPIEISNIAEESNVEYRWEDGTQSHAKEVKQYGKYILTASNGICVSQDEIELKPAEVGCGCQVVIPNVWSLKDNNVLDIESKLPECARNRFEMGIFDRWGNKIATLSENQRFKRLDDLNDGVYVYQIRYGKDFNAIQMGEFVIIH